MALTMDSYYLRMGGPIDWIGLDLFNDDTRPAGHISRPTQVGSLTVYNL